MSDIIVPRSTSDIPSQHQPPPPTRGSSLWLCPSCHPQGDPKPELPPKRSRNSPVFCSIPYRDGTTIYQAPGTSLAAHIISCNPLNNTVGNTRVLQIRKQRLKDSSLAKDTQLKGELYSMSSKLRLVSMTFAAFQQNLLLHVLRRSSEFRSITHPWTQQSFLYSQAKISLTFSSVHLSPLPKSSWDNFHIGSDPLSADLFLLSCSSGWLTVLSFPPPSSFLCFVSFSMERASFHTRNLDPFAPLPSWSRSLKSPRNGNKGCLTPALSPSEEFSSGRGREGRALLVLCFLPLVSLAFFELSLALR